jgi:molecular chaperone GrpE
MTHDDHILDQDTTTTGDDSADTSTENDSETVSVDIDDTVDDVTFEQDADTRENTAPDAIAKIAKLKLEIEKLKSEKQQYLEGWQRDKAEFINARKRDEESKSDFLKFALMGFVEELLPVVDSFESALKIMKSTESADLSGVEQIYNQLQSVLKKQHIESFGVISEVFDPARHQAIGTIEATEAQQDQTIAEVLQSGYLISGKIIRPALVKVFQA